MTGVGQGIFKTKISTQKSIPAAAKPLEHHLFYTTLKFFTFGLTGCWGMIAHQVPHAHAQSFEVTDTRVYDASDNPPTGQIGKIDITQGGNVTVMGGFQATGTSLPNFVGNSGGSGTLTITGTGTQIDLPTGNLFVSGGTLGTLSILDGGFLRVGGNTNVAAISGNGVVTVSGQGSSLDSLGQVNIGGLNTSSGKGFLNILDGATSTSQGALVTIGRAGEGTVLVSGNGSRWTITNQLKMSELATGVGKLTVADTALVTAHDALIGGAGNGSVTVTGAGSRFEVETETFLGVSASGQGTLTVTSGGRMETETAYIGYGGTGTANLSGAGSTMSVTDQLSIGTLTGSSGTLNVTTGAALATKRAILGERGTGTAMLDGTGSSWAIDEDLLLASQGGNATLNVGNGATLTAEELLFGESGGGTAQVTLSGGAILEAGQIKEQANVTSSLNFDNGILRLTKDQANLFSGMTLGDIVIGAGGATFDTQAYDVRAVTGLAGSGAFTKAGSGTLTLDGASTFNGATSVSAGTLNVSGSIANSSVTVLGGAILAGNGTSGQTTVQANGHIAPGASIGTLTINGNYVQQAGAFYDVEFDPATLISDLIVVNGTATLESGTQLVATNFSGTSLSAGQQYTIMTTTGGLSGTFSLTNGAISPFFSLLDSYDAFNAYLTVTQTNTLQTIGKTPNQIATGTAVEGMGSGNIVYDALMAQQSEAGVLYALDQLSGEIHASAKTSAIETGHLTRDAILSRLREASCNSPRKNMSSESEACQTDTQGLSVWQHGLGSWMHTESDGNASALSSRTGGFLIGADAEAFDTWRFGMLAGYSHSSFDVSRMSASGSSENVHLGLYGAGELEAIALRAGIIHTWHNIDTRRSVDFIAESHSGSYDASSLNTFGEMAYRFNTPYAALEPYIGLAHQRLKTDGFTETGGNSALTLDAQATHTTFTTVGLRASTDFLMGNQAITAHGSLGWRHAFGDVSPTSTARFASSSRFSIEGAPIGEDAALVEAGLDLSLSGRTNLGLNYSGQFGSGTASHSINARLDMRF